MPVDGKVVLITGGARGMGREMVRAFLKEGAKVIATDISWIPTGVSNDDYDFRAEIKDNPNALTAVMDITLQSHINEVYEDAMEKFGTVDVVINNGGTRQRDLYLRTMGSVEILNTDISEWQQMFNTHVFGNLRVIKTFVKPMIEKQSGSIVNTSSSQLLNAHGAGKGEATGYGLSREASYQPAKAAMGSMTIYLAQELKKHNIAANVMLPGHTATTGIGRAGVRAQRGPPAHGHVGEVQLHSPAGSRRQRRAPGAASGRAGRQRHHRPVDELHGIQRGARPRRVRGVGLRARRRGCPRGRHAVTQSAAAPSDATTKERRPALGRAAFFAFRPSPCR